MNIFNLFKCKPKKEIKYSQFDFKSCGEYRIKQVEYSNGKYVYSAEIFDLTARDFFGKFGLYKNVVAGWKRLGDAKDQEGAVRIIHQHRKLNKLTTVNVKYFYVNWE